MIKTETDTYLAAAIIGHLLNLDNCPQTVTDVVTLDNGSIVIHMERCDLKGTLTIKPDQLTIE